MSALLQQTQYYDKYSRYRYDLNRREDWYDTVKRVTDYLFSFDENGILDEKEKQEIFDAIFDQDVMPSMRNLAMAGEAAQRQNACSYNCAAHQIDDLYRFYETVIILMSGSGLGYSVENKHISKLPTVKKQSKDQRPILFRVPDTTEGWAEAIYFSITQWFKGNKVQFDFTNIRPAGSILKVKGGRASGPQVLEESLGKIEAVINGARERQLTSLEVHDIMCYIARCIVSGGVRRSAMICIFDFDDYEMMTCKNPENMVGNDQRYMSNNSAVFTKKMSYDEISQFMENMFNSYSGEPGIFSRYAIKQSLPERREYRDNMIPNPCQPGFAKVLTPHGIRTFDDIDVGDYIWSEDKWVQIVNKVHTGNKPVFEYLTTGGRFVGTKEHRVVSHGEKIEVRDADGIDLLPHSPDYVLEHDGQAVIDGLIIGDGSVHMTSKEKVYLDIGENDMDYFTDPIVSEYILEPHPVKYGRAWKVNTTITPEELPHTYERVIPDRYYYGNQKTVCSFLSGLYSANGSVVDNRITLKATSFELIKQVQDMLSSIGIRSYYTINKPTLVEHRNGVYESKQSYDLNITSDRHIFSLQINFIQGYKGEKLHEACKIRSQQGVKTHNIVDVNYLGDFDVYDITVDGEHHTYWSSGVNVSNCGEIILRGSGQFCNLTSVVCRPGDDLTSLRKKVKLATILGTLQAMSDNFPGLRDDWHNNQVEERLLGVDLNGIMDVPFVQDSRVLEILYKTSTDTNHEYSIRLGINPATAVTCVKPSGNASVMLNTSPGIHARWDDYYIRRVQLNESNPILGVLQMNNVPVEKSHHLSNTYVASFPVKSPEGAITNGTHSALQQLENWKLVKKHWAEHSVSCTISYRENEKDQIILWVYENQDIISGLSFLPKDDAVYAQMPYEKITKEQYEEMIKDFPEEVDWNLLHELEDEDRTNASQVAACSGDKCLISF